MACLRNDALDRVEKPADVVRPYVNLPRRAGTMTDHFSAAAPP